MLVGCSSEFECVQNRQTLFAMIDISCWSLTQFCSASPNAKQVIAYLKGETHGIAKTAQAGDSFCIVRSKKRSHFGSAAHQCGGLAANHIHIHRDGNIIAGFETDVEILTFGKHKAGLIECSTKTHSNSGIYPFIYHTPECEACKCKHTIARIDCLRNTPYVPKCWSVATLCILVFNIIVN